jgi:hypothetical protein
MPASPLTTWGWSAPMTLTNTASASSILDSPRLCHRYQWTGKRIWYPISNPSLSSCLKI